MEDRRDFLRRCVSVLSVGAMLGAAVALPVFAQEGPPGPPPEPQMETPPPGPPPGGVWIPGHWVWRGRWIWVGGRYGVAPRAGAVWVPGHYDRRGFWIEGHWRYR
jgi:hypothetical protein